jgi:hypothetical protein
VVVVVVEQAVVQLQVAMAVGVAALVVWLVLSVQDQQR